MLEDASSTGGYFRVHVHPKRFPAAHEIPPAEWASRIVHDGEGFVVVNKPAGLQVPPTVDNVRESLLAKVEEVSARDSGSEGTSEVCCDDGCLLGSGAECRAHLVPPCCSVLCVCSCQVLGLELGVLSPPHRLDAGTEGLVVLAKTTEFTRCRGR